jgi:hypothetical protein
MVRRAVRGMGLVVALSAAACGPDAANVPFVRQDHCPVTGCVDAAPAPPPDAPPPGTIPPEPLEPWDTSGEGPLSGIFAVQSILTARVGVIVQLRQLYRLRIVQKGTDIHQKTTLCAFKLPVVPNVATLAIPPALQTLIQTKSVEVEGPYLSSPAVLEAAYTPPPFLLVIGASLGTPAIDPLPTLMNMAGEVDEDMDGNPGVTLDANVLTCTTDQKLYVALRTSGTTTGTISSPDTIDGTTDVHVDQSVLGYSDPCLATAVNITIQVMPGAPLHAQRVGAAEDVDMNGNVSCPEILLAAPTLFGDAWKM